MEQHKVRFCWIAYYVLLVGLYADSIVAGGAAVDDARQQQDEAQPQQQEQHQRRSYPDIRRLARLLDEGLAHERIHIVFEAVNDQSNDNGEGKACDRNQVIARRTAKVMKTLDGLCTSCTRTFPPAGIHEQAHIAAGLDLHYDCECASTSTTTSSGVLQQDLFIVQNDENGNDNNENNNNHESTPVHKTVQAISKLTEIMKEQKSKRVADQQDGVLLMTANGGGGGNDDDDDYLGIEQLDGSYAVQTTEFKGTVPPSPPINEYDHPELWARRQWLAEKYERRRRQQEEQYRRREDDQRELLGGSQDPNDPYYQEGQQSHYDAIDLSSAWEYMDAHNGWENAPSTVVHVQDTGWDFSHPDSGVNRWVNPGEICGNGIDDDGNELVDDCYGYNFGDNTGNGDLLGDQDHGSHVSGTIAATTDNGLGVVGIAGGGKNNNGSSGQRGVSIMTGVVFGRWNADGFAQSIVYAGDEGAMFSSNSWGYVQAGDFDPAVKAAIDYAVSRGVLVVFAAGNNNSNKAYYPGYFSNVLTVAATYNNGVRAGFSNHGNHVDIAAPGVNILSTGTASTGYMYMSGTSMACPHVSGVLAMGKSMKPEATAAELRSCLLSSADSTGDSSLGAGMVNPLGFLECLNAMGGKAPPIPPPTPPSTPTPPNNSPVPPSPTPGGGGGRDDDQCSTCGNCQQSRSAKFRRTGCECQSCQDKICAADSWCCEREWDSICANAAKAQCPCVATDDDNDDDKNDRVPSPTLAPAGGGEQPQPSPSLRSPPTTSLSPSSGDEGGEELQCGENFECGNCNKAKPRFTGCSCSDCQVKVCLKDKWCCDVAWDDECAKDADVLCACHGTNCGSEYCTVTLGIGPGCPSCPTCEQAVCDKDRYCCRVHWDTKCAQAASTNCV